MEGYCLPASDLEAQWLAEEPDARILTPPSEAFTRTAKPFADVAELLPVRVPAYLSLKSPARELYNFAISHNWSIWAKGPLMDACRVRSWAGMQATQKILAGAWGDQPYFLQQHVGGKEVALAFAAFEGRLLGSIYTEKRLITTEGKCWAAADQPCPPQLEEALKGLVRELNWTGGGELEFVRDLNGEFWLIDWNYRFPAWIYGATLLGTNLPALLIEAASGAVPLPTTREAEQFTRVVVEIPVRTSYQLPAPPPITGDGRVSSKFSAITTSGLTVFMNRLTDRKPDHGKPADNPNRLPPTPLDGPVETEIRNVWNPALETPVSLLLPDLAKTTFSRVQSLLSAPLPLPVSAAYSVKTNPDPTLMTLARDMGFRAEVISVEEALWAHEIGFDLAGTVYNGPVPLVPARLEGERIHAVFADSLESFERLCQLDPPPAELIGLRLNPFESFSRFGIKLGSPERFAAVADAVRDRLPEGVKFGIHFHLQSSTTGTGLWLKHARALVQLARSLEVAGGRKIELLDLGGGWTSENLVPFLTKELAGFLDFAKERLKNVQQVFIEPGKALCEQVHVLASRVLEVRETDGSIEIVADACLADVPQAGFLPRDVYWLGPNGEMRRLNVGTDRILGRVCMEHDVLVDGLSIPGDITANDTLIFSHAGAYDISMSYKFGLGGSHA